jgi:hypothetical protein
MMKTTGSPDTAPQQALRDAKAALKSARLTAKASKARLRALKSELKLQRKHGKWARSQVRAAKQEVAQRKAEVADADPGAQAKARPAKGKRPALELERLTVTPVVPVRAERVEPVAEVSTDKESFN